MPTTFGKVFSMLVVHSTSMFFWQKLRGIELQGELIPHVRDVGNTFHGPFAHVCMYG